MQADPESMPANYSTHELSGTDALAGMDSGSASELEATIFAGPEAGSNAPSCWRPPGMTNWGPKTWFVIFSVFQLLLSYKFHAPQVFLTMQECRSGHSFTIRCSMFDVGCSSFHFHYSYAPISPYSPSIVFSNRVYWPIKVRIARPTAPFLFFATRISALPLLGLFSSLLYTSSR